MFDDEIWKDIESYEGKYKVSNYGRIYSVSRNKLRVFDQSNRFGYLRVQLGAKEKKSLVHRLVAKAFVDGYFDGAVVNHKDLDKTNNKASNLEWVTNSENSKHAFLRGRQKGSFKCKPYFIKYSNGEIKEFTSIKHVAVFLKVAKTTLYNKLKNNNGYIQNKDCYIIPCVSND